MRSLLFTLVLLFASTTLAQLNPNKPKPKPAPSAPAAKPAATTDPIAQLQRDMARVEGGSFTMGCTSAQGDACGDAEKPSHRVTVSGFWLGKYEVTQALWKAVMGDNPSGLSSCAQCPVESVSWNDAQEFIRKLNAKTGKRYRLPTEAEWEYASRGGNKSHGTLYAGSNDVASVAWFVGNSGEGTNPVGRMAPNELGLFDMSGNVSEWCADWYGKYSASAAKDPKGPADGQGRVLRGGSWSSIPWYISSFARGSASVDARNNDLGFRLARTE